MKLRRGPIVEFAFTPGEMVSERTDKDEHFVRPKRAGGDKWRKLERLYLLDDGVNNPDTAIEQITGAEAVRALVDQTYLFNYF